MYKIDSEFTVTVFRRRNGKEPFKNWLLSLDTVTRKRILLRITKLQAGHFGDCKQIDKDIFELRYFFGAGYRIYFGKERDKIIILLCGGDKDSQMKDIKKSRQYLGEYYEQENEKDKQL